MKDHKFILRSTSIKSKPTINLLQPPLVPNDSQCFPSINSAKNVSILQIQREMQQKDQQLKQRLLKLNTNLKTLEKQYKQNLKQGFQHKIKSYRLQAVMERKMMKQTIRQNLQLNQLQQIQQKHEHALKKKEFKQYISFKQQQKRQRELEKIKQKNEIEKRRIYHSLTARERQIQSNNKALHDKVLSQQKHKDRKRNYLEYWKQQKVKKQEYQMKKQYLQKILTNTKRIRSLKEELEGVETRCEKLLTDQDNDRVWRDRSMLFVTI